MPFTIFPDTPAGWDSVNAVPDPKQIEHNPSGRKITVITGNDINDTSILVKDIELTRLGLFAGSLSLGGQPLLNKVVLYVYTTIPTTGNPAQQNYWRECAKFNRGDAFINQLRIAIAPFTNAEMDAIFRAGNGYTP